MGHQYSENELQKISKIQTQQELGKQQEVSFCTVDDEVYPNMLRNLKNRPSMLYYRGNIEILNQYKSIAVIGSRKSGENGKKLAFHAAQRMGKSGVNIVNGLAMGCDAEAIRGALEVGARCVAILPCGLEQIVPRTNTKLAEEILEKGGCLLSEYPVGTRVEKYRYIERDRLQSGISQGVFIVEAETDSGTMHTAEFAMKQYKRLACYSHKLAELSSGNKYLESAGKAQVIRNLTDIDSYVEEILKEDEYEQLSFI